MITFQFMSLTVKDSTLWDFLWICLKQHAVRIVIDQHIWCCNFNGEQIVGSKDSISLILFLELAVSYGFNISWYAARPLHSAMLIILGFTCDGHRRIQDFPDSLHSWNYQSAIGSGMSFLSARCISSPIKGLRIPWLQETRILILHAFKPCGHLFDSPDVISYETLFV